MTLPLYEKLGSFYLGREYDLESRALGSAPLLYDSKDLVTHAVCVGMTGSGKTGLCLALLEEAALDGVPAVIIDPKGDLSNLLLTFPELRPEDFRPWINEDDARRKGMEPDAYAAAQAEQWKSGLAAWDQDGARIGRLRAAAEFTVYTPGSTAATPVSVLRSFDAPPAALLEDAELLRDRVSSTASSLLGLLGIEGDPLTSRDHILVSAILQEAWTQGRGLDIPELIRRIQSPGFTRLGVMELETVYPSSERFELALRLNSLVASPGFAAWTEGVALDLASLLYTPAGKPRMCIFSIAHLGDAERMFFVSLLLNQTLAWVRAQPGTTSLRALVYMDEIAGYVPPTANPPSKRPLLTLMKQARAFGVGVVLATQNPVDLDYKGLSNAGTWFLGRLQTERDKARVLDGLEGAMASASGGFDRAAIDSILSRLSARVFLMHNVHEDGPVIFQSRWAMSYLRGPLTRQQLRTLTQGRSGERAAPGASERPAAAAPAVVPASAGRGAARERPVLPPDVPQFFLPGGDAGGVRYAPLLMGSARIHYSDARMGIETDVMHCCLAPIVDGPVPVDWDRAEVTELTEGDLLREPAAGASFEPLPAEAGRARSYETWKKQLADALYRTQRLSLTAAPDLKMVARPGESGGDFRIRLRHAARERRDAAVAALRQKYAARLRALEERERRAAQAVEVQKDQASGASFRTAVSIGSAVLGAMFGRKGGSVGRAATAARSSSRASQEARDVARAEETLAAVRAQRAELDAQMNAESDGVTAEIDAAQERVETLTLKPKKSAISVRAVVLVWKPVV
ncbi:MAG: DUF87 domain-containing protein [Planctomycetota bacterium]|nr:DUF87 domain-containing protein [Planctomycetota bacterium]